MAAYFRVPSVKHYLIFWADRPQVIHHRRRDEEEGIETRVLMAGEIELDPPGVLITVEEIYAGSRTSTLLRDGCVGARGSEL
jgi:hypothetical protein